VTDSLRTKSAIGFRASHEHKLKFLVDFMCSNTSVVLYIYLKRLKYLSSKLLSNITVLIVCKEKMT